MVPKPTVCTGFTLMKKNHFKFCVTLQLTAEAGPPFRGAWMALLTFMSTGNHTKKGFGNLEGEVWLGNDYLHRLTASANMLFRTDMEDYEGD